MPRPLAIAVLLAACKVKEPPPNREPFADGFERTVLGPDYRDTGPGYAVVGGALSAHGAHNHPLWLRKKLPHDVRIEFDAWSTEPRGDIKVEVFGDGHSYDPDGGRYMATGYEVIFGGWYNAKSIIARLDEHGTDMVQRAEPKVVPGQHYHWKIERKRNVITWFVDDMTTPFLTFVDPEPLRGEGNHYFGFNDWEAEVWFDDLRIAPR